MSELIVKGQKCFEEASEKGPREMVAAWPGAAAEVGRLEMKRQNREYMRMRRGGGGGGEKRLGWL